MTTEQTTNEPNTETAMQAIPVSRAALALHNLSAKEETRPLLATIWTKDGRFTAADGFIGGLVKPTAEDATPPDGLIIPWQTAKASVAKTTAKRRLAAIGRTEQGGAITTQAKPHETVTYSLPDDLSPSLDLAALRHKSTEAPHASVVVGVEKLKRIATFFSTAMAETDGMVELRVWESSKPVEFRGRSAEREELTAILMPMVTGGYSGAGAWLFDAPDGVENPDRLMDHHFSLAIKDGRAGEAAQAIELIRTEPDGTVSTLANEDAAGWTFRRVGDPEEIKAMDRKAHAAEALAILGYDDDTIDAAITAIDAAGVKTELVAD